MKRNLRIEGTDSVLLLVTEVRSMALYWTSVKLFGFVVGG